MEAKSTEADRNELWKQRLQDLEASNMTQKDWCRQHQIPESTLRYWVRKLHYAPTVDMKTESPEGWVQMPSSIAESQPDNEITIICSGIQMTLSKGADPVLRDKLLKVMVGL